MRREIAQVLKRDIVGLIQYGDCDNPHGTLGRHLVSNGQVISCYHPYAQKMRVILDNGLTYPMEPVERTNMFSVFLPLKDEIPYEIEMIYGDGRTWKGRDPYNFDPQLSDLDIYLFNEGTHYEIYQKLGAHPMTVDGVEGVYFAVWAPNAKRVSVVGNFNIWDGRIYPMRRLKKSGIFELFIPGIQCGELYKYEIKTKLGEIFLKADPYANMAEVRPCTASVVTDINTYQWEDKEWMENRKKDIGFEKPMSIYEVHLGSWKRKEGTEEMLTYREMASDLVSYVEKMGYTHVEFMGIMEHPFDDSWGYQVTGYFAPTSRYGSLQDFMYLVDCFHKRGIGVILDWVPGHFSKEEHGLVKFDGTCLYEHQNPNKGKQPLCDALVFKYECKEVKNFLIGSALFWIRQCHIDGLRIDAVSSMVYLHFGKKNINLDKRGYGKSDSAIEFLKHLNSIIGKYGEGGYTIAEEATAWNGVSRPTKDGGLGFDYKWNIGWIHDFLQYMETEPYRRKEMQTKLTFGMMYAYTEKFILSLSHDEVASDRASIIERIPGSYFDKFANMRVAYGFMFGHPGKKLIFMGQDFMQWSGWEFYKSLDWHLLKNDIHQKSQLYVKDLLCLYKNHPAFYEQDYNPIGFEWMNCTNAKENMVSFVRRSKDGGECLLFICNFSANDKVSFRVGVPREGSYHVILNSDEEKYGGEGCYTLENIHSEKIFWDGKEDSIEVNIAAFTVLILEYQSNPIMDKLEEIE
ncbi:MAG: 1,4-alpha-glucan branching protein GlgB [Lachnospiraceae bacterium]